MTSLDQSSSPRLRRERRPTVPVQWAQGAKSICLEKGRGSHVWDVDGHEYVDFAMALGPVLLGYEEPVVDDAIRRHLDGDVTATSTHLEVDVAEKIIAMCPGVDAVRFTNSGSETVTAAVGAARALTGRDIVLLSGYDAWQDWSMGSTTRNAGVPKAVADVSSRFTFGDPESLEQALAFHPDQVAALVIEPSGVPLPEPGFLAFAVDVARAHGAVSIFDEVITGFRVAPGGLRQRYGIEPDLSCYGRTLGNGMPVSAVAGRTGVMRAFDRVLPSPAHEGETLSLAAAAAVLETIADGTVLAKVECLGRRLRDGMESAIARHGVSNRITLGGEPQRTVVSFIAADELSDRRWLQHCFAEQGVLFGGSLFVYARHTEADLDQALTAFDTTCADLASGRPIPRNGS